MHDDHRETGGDGVQREGTSRNMNVNSTGSVTPSE
jgi:hypothetical protein